MALTPNKAFNAVVVNFNSTSLGVLTISAADVDPTTKDITNAEFVDPYNNIPGVYDASTPDFVTCVNKLIDKTAKLYYQFNGSNTIAISEIAGDDNTLFEHFVDHDPVYQELQRKARITQAGLPPVVKPIVATDKKFYHYNTGTAVVGKPVPTINTMGGIQTLFSSMAAADWYATEAAAAAAKSTGEDTLYVCTVTYLHNADKNEYEAIVSDPEYAEPRFELRLVQSSPQ